MGSRSLSLIFFTLLVAIAPVASAAEVIVNGQEIALGHRLIPSTEGTLAPLAELARYLGAEVTQGDREALLRWGGGAEARLRLEDLQFRDGLAYLPIDRLAELLGARVLKFDDSIYLFSPQAELLSLTYSPAAGPVRLRLSRLAPLEVNRKGPEVEFRLYNAVLRLAPRTGRFPRGPVERLELYAVEPDQIILKLRLRRAAAYRITKGFADGGYLIELELGQESSQVRRSAGSPISNGTPLTPWISYHHEERRVAAGSVMVDYLLVKNYQAHYRLRAALPQEGLARLDELVRALGGAAGINANFFDPGSDKPIGLVIRDGQVLSPPYGRRAALGIDLFGRMVIFNQDSPPFLPLRDAVGAGPLLLEGGRIAIDHRGEGFTPDFINKRAARSAIGLTPTGDLLMLVAAKDGRSVGMAMEELAEFLQELGAADALALDGGSSASLVFRRGLNLHSIGTRRIAVGLVLIPK
ncbi:MAG: phosphodiester glycosidase family protein [Candidatus Bipolaricaulia bacterium]